MSATALAICPFCQHQAPAPALLKGARTQCPKCANFYIFKPAEPTAEMAADTAMGSRPLKPRIARRRVMHIQCPNCACDLQLTRTRYVRLRKRDLVKLKRKLKLRKAAEAAAAAAIAAPIAEPAEATATEVAAATAPTAPIEPAPAPEPAAILEPAAVLVPPLSAPSPSRKRPTRTDDSESQLPLEWLVPCILVLTSSAIFATAFSFSAPVVLPLAAVGCVGAAVVLIAAVRRREFLVRSGATAAYGALALLILWAAPGAFGSKYYTFRQHAPDENLVQVIPKAGQPATDIPKDSDWVDASRYALEQHGVVLEIVNATLGKVETRTAAGTLKMSSEPYLVVWLRRRHAGDAQEFGSNPHGQKEGQDAELQLTLTDELGRDYPRQKVDLGWNSAGALRSSNVFPTAMSDDVFAFAAPPADVGSLRLEISSPQFPGKPMRFTIPRSMIGRPIR